MPIEEELNERAVLLMRFFWKDKTYEIGSNLGIPYFRTVQHYWEIDHYKGALEISKAMSKDQLLKLLAENPPKYGLDFGGFQGRYYSAVAEGQVEEKDSWPQVHRNFEKARQKWGDRGYGVLRALINKGGSSPYFDLVHEIEKVLGYEIWPSVILPSMTPLKLVFKTGSRRYPEWTIPPEIRPFISMCLEKFKQSESIPKPRATPDVQLLRLERGLDEAVTEMVHRRRNINRLFESRFGFRLFRDNEMAVTDIRRPCSNEENFNNRIMSLYLLIDQVNVGELRQRTRNPSSESGSVNQLEAFLEENAPQCDKFLISTFRMIARLRSTKYPIHSDDPEFLSILTELGQKRVEPDWQELWETILRRYLEALRELEQGVSGGLTRSESATRRIESAVSAEPELQRAPKSF